MIVIKSLRLRQILRQILPWVAIPLCVLLGATVFSDKGYAYVTLLVTMLSLLLFIAGFEKKRTGTRRLILVAVMVALSVAGRFLPLFKPITALTVLTAMYLGSEAGFLTGALSAVISNFYFGQGPWTPFQMFAMGLIGFLAGVCFQKGLLRAGRAPLAIFGAVSVVLIYGGWPTPLLWIYGRFYGIMAHSNGPCIQAHCCLPFRIHACMPCPMYCFCFCLPSPLSRSWNGYRSNMECEPV